MPVDRDIDRIPEDVDKFLEGVSKSLDKLQHQTATWNGLNRNTEQNYRRIHREVEMLQRKQQEGLRFNLEQQRNLDDLLKKKSEIEGMMSAKGMEGIVAEVTGGTWKGKIEGILGAFSSIPGLGGLAGLTQMLPGAGTVVAITRVIGTLMTEMDKLTEQFAISRRDLSAPGIESWRLGWMEMARYRIELSASMRRMTNWAAGAEEALQILGEVKRTGGLQELTVGGERLNETFEKMNREMKAGRIGDEFHDAADRVALLAGTIDNLSKAYGVQTGAITDQLRVLRRYTTERETDAMKLLEQWHMLAYTANEVNVSQEDYIKWVESAEKEMRFYGYTLQDINAIAHNFAEELKTGVVSLEEMTSFINEAIGTVNLPRAELFRQYMGAHMEDLSESTRSYLKFLEDQFGREGMLVMQRAILEGADIERIAEAYGMPMAPLPEELRGEEVRRTAMLELGPQYAEWQRGGLAQQMGAQTAGEIALLGGLGVMGPLAPIFRGMESGPMGQRAEQTLLNLEAISREGVNMTALQEEANQSFAEMTEEFKQFRTWGKAIVGLKDIIADCVIGGDTLRTIDVTPAKAEIGQSGY